VVVGVRCVGGFWVCRLACFFALRVGKMFSRQYHMWRRERRDAKHDQYLVFNVYYHNIGWFEDDVVISAL
jgi:hypothetical protein